MLMIQIPQAAADIIGSEMSFWAPWCTVYAGKKQEQGNNLERIVLM